MRLQTCRQSVLAGVFSVVVSVLAACGGGGDSPPPPITPPTTLSAPAGFTATAKDGYATLSWNPVSEATSYNLYWSTASGVNKASGNKLTGVSTPLNHSGLVNGTTYYYVVTTVGTSGESAESSQAVTVPVNGGNAADPLHGDQWHLKNTGQLGATTGEDLNVEPAWSACGTGNACRGEGVRIAVVDDGLEIAHEDLAANVATGLSYNYVTSNTDPTNDPADAESNHGTAVAGIVAARDLNRDFPLARSLRGKHW
jgi:hypothetical protein